MFKAHCLLDIPCEYCQTLGTEGDVILWAPSEYLLATKGNGQIKTDLSIHIRYVHDESVLRLVFRVDGQISWANSVTPFKGSDSLSPVVTVETRS